MMSFAHPNPLARCGKPDPQSSTVFQGTSDLALVEGRDNRFWWHRFFPCFVRVLKSSRTDEEWVK